MGGNALFELLLFLLSLLLERSAPAYFSGSG